MLYNQTPFGFGSLNLKMLRYILNLSFAILEVKQDLVHEQRTFPNLPLTVMLQDFVYLDYLVFPPERHISDHKQPQHDWLFYLKCTKCTQFCNIYNLS